MAKSKAKSKVHDEEPIEELEQIAADDVEDVAVEDVEDVETEADVDEVEDVAVEEDADFADIDADEEVQAKAGDDDDADEPPPAPAPVPDRPRPRLTRWAIALILLNWIAAPAFLIVAALDYKARLDYGYRAVLNYTRIYGLPLKEEDDFASLSNQTRPHVFLTKEMVKAEYNKRPGVVKTFREEFVPIDEPVPVRLRPSDMTEELLGDIYGGLPNHMPTLDDEIDRLKTDLPKRIADAADEVLKSAKDDAGKKDIVHKSLFPLVATMQLKGDLAKDNPVVLWEIDKLNDKLKTISGADLDAWVKDSVQRRLYYDILAPLSLFSPADVKYQDKLKDNKKFRIERIADQGVTIDEIKNHLVERLSGTIAETFDPKIHIGPDYFAAGLKRDSVAKRQKIAFVLFTLGQVERPTLNKKLIDRGVDRAQAISGLYEFTIAAVRYVRTINILEGRLAKATREDRIGIAYKNDKGAASRTEGFIDEYERQIDQLVRIASNLGTAQKRLASVTSRHDEFVKIHEQRAKQYADALAKLKSERATTVKYMDDLRVLQQQLHTALVELSEAAARNLRLVDEITDYETRINARFAPKGGKK